MSKCCQYGYTCSIYITCVLFVTFLVLPVKDCKSRNVVKGYYFLQDDIAQELHYSTRVVVCIEWPIDYGFYFGFPSHSQTAVARRRRGTHQRRERDYDDDDAHGQDIPARRATGSDGGGDGGGDRTTASGTSHNRVD